MPDKKSWKREDKNARKPVTLSKEQEKKIIKELQFLEKKLQALEKNSFEKERPKITLNNVEEKNELQSQILNDLLLPPSEVLRGTFIEKEAFYQTSIKLALLQSTIESSTILDSAFKQFVEESMNHTKVTFAKKSGFKIGRGPDEIPWEIIRGADAYRHP